MEKFEYKGLYTGGVEVDAKLLDNLITVAVIPSVRVNGELVRYKWSETFPTYTNGSKAMIRFAKPSDEDMLSWTMLDLELFEKLVNYFGIDNILTETEFEAKLLSENYT